MSEVAGTVRVRVKGSKAFVELNAAEGIPVGSTVDTTHGTVLLTSQSKSGGASQSAKFFDGIFLVTQQGPITKLKLTQKLAKCTAGKASVAKKRPKKRRLWGDGKGKFRTEGKHSAATVVRHQVAGAGLVRRDPDQSGQRRRVRARQRQAQDDPRQGRQAVPGEAAALRRRSRVSLQRRVGVVVALFGRTLEKRNGDKSA